MLLPLHQPRLGAPRLPHKPRLRLPRRAHEARPPPPRDGPLPHARHRALHEGRAQQDDRGRGGDPHELMASLFDSERERKVRALEKGVDLCRVRPKAPVARGQARHLHPRLPAAPGVGLARRDRPRPHREEPRRAGRVLLHPRARREVRGPRAHGGLELPRARVLRGASSHSASTTSSNDARRGGEGRRADPLTRAPTQQHART